MFNQSQSQLIHNPFGITVFGSSLIRVEPDLVSLHFSVKRLQKKPQNAFSDVKKSAQKVRKFLKQAEVPDVNSSRVTIEQSFRYKANEHQFVGYTATINFHVLLHKLDKMESILSGIIDAGVNQVSNVNYQTTRLKELRADARRRAVEAAQEKAINYCSAAGVSLGEIIHIDDVNPDTLRKREGHVVSEIQPDDSDDNHAFNPGSITIGGAVKIAFKLKQQSQQKYS